MCRADRRCSGSVTNVYECVKDWDYDRERVVEIRTDPSPMYLPFDRVEY